MPGTEAERRQATHILPLVTRHHYLLVTLLLFNSLAAEALPIFLDNLVPAWLAVILSVSLVLFFGEILPSAIFTGPNQLAIASHLSWFVLFLMTIFSPIAWPVARALDYILGVEGLKRYNRAEIAALVQVQQELQVRQGSEDFGEDPLHPDEVCIVNGVLQTAEKHVGEAMITMDNVFSLSIEDKLSVETMADIIAAGYSRVPVYEGEDRRNVRGYLQIKKLIVLSPEDERVISSLALRMPVVVSPNKSLLELLNTFQTGRSHLAIVSHSPGITLEALKSGVRLEGAARPVGIITIEDIIEEIIQEEIMDESDRMTAFIEGRAKDVLLKYTRRRRNRRHFGRQATLGRTTPGTQDPMERAFLRQLSREYTRGVSPAGEGTASLPPAAHGGTGSGAAMGTPSPSTTRPGGAGSGGTHPHVVRGHMHGQRASLAGSSPIYHPPTADGGAGVFASPGSVGRGKGGEAVGEPGGRLLETRRRWSVFGHALPPPPTRSVHGDGGGTRGPGDVEDPSGARVGGSGGGSGDGSSGSGDGGQGVRAPLLAPGGSLPETKSQYYT